MICPYKVEENKTYPYGCSYNGDKFYGNSPTPKCGFPVTLFKVQSCSKKEKIKKCKTCSGKGYVILKDKPEEPKIESKCLGSFRVSDWFPLGVFLTGEGKYKVESTEFTVEEIESMKLKIKQQQKKLFRTKEMNQLFSGIKRKRVYHALVVLTVTGFLSHSWGWWELEVNE